MRVLQLSPHDHQGGAARIAWYLFEGYKERGIESYLAVGEKTLDDPNILAIDHSKYAGMQVLGRIRKWVEIMIGLENFNYPATRHIPSLPPSHPDLVHAHNLHGRYFDLRILPFISRQFPTVLTLHDTWLLSGHCAYAIGCERWRYGCGRCPDLSLPPEVKRDATAYNWSRKKRIYEQCRVYIATPSQWLLDQVEYSMLMPAVAKAKVIHNGVETSVYAPTDKDLARQQLGLPGDAFVLLYVIASRMRQNPYKDYSTIEQVLSLLQNQAPQNKKIIFLGLGEGGKTEVKGSLEKRFIPYQNDVREVAKYYQAADVYVHAARADTFPNVVLEALASGTPVIATAVGGISEQVIDGKTGFLVPAKGAELMTNRIIELMNDAEKKEKMSFEAAEDARKRFSLSRMVDEYLDYYCEVITDFAEISDKVTSKLERRQ